VETPWGTARWMGPVSPEATTDYEQGFLLLGTGDRPLDGLQGKPIVPEKATVEADLASLYLDAPAKLELDGRGARGIRLRFHRDGSGAMSGTLILDPNTCSLDAFGDPVGSTRMALRTVKVTIERQRLADPANRGRWFCEVHGEGLARDLVLIMDLELEPYVLKREKALVPLFFEDTGP